MESKKKLFFVRIKKGFEKIYEIKGHRSFMISRKISEMYKYA